MVVLRECHLAGYEKGKGIAEDEAVEFARGLGAGVVVGGYVEEAGDQFYSCAVVLDGHNGVSPKNSIQPGIWGFLSRADQHTGAALLGRLRNRIGPRSRLTPR